MGCFGYMCSKCGQSVRGGEQSVLRHIRHGVILGETTGTYDSYGQVHEDEIFRGFDNSISGINSHEEICKSEFDLEDSCGFDAKIYNGEPMLWMEYRAAKIVEGVQDLSPYVYDEWKTLPLYIQPEIKSGTQAFHKYCFDRMSEEEKADLTPSKHDPNQSWGKPRKKYCK